MVKKKQKEPQGSLRIIGGQWRGRKLQFPALDGVRPTGDRIRETLFNWLMYQLAGKKCLDLFAGSGALGLEALSRGAAHVTFVEKDPKVHAQLAANLKTLKAENADLLLGDAMKTLTELSPVDLVFLDPPFPKNLMKGALESLIERQLLSEDALVYVEYETGLDIDIASEHFETIKKKTTGQVEYRLLKYNGAGEKK